MGDSVDDVKAVVEKAARLVPSFRRVSPEEEAFIASTAHVPESYMVQYGYHDGHTTDYSLPKHLVRYIEPTEGEFDQQVEYDMDEQGTWVAKSARRRAAANRWSLTV